MTLELPPEIKDLLDRWAMRRLTTESGLIRSFILEGLEKLCPTEVEAILSPKKTIHDLVRDPVRVPNSPNRPVMTTRDGHA